jgi:anthranilate phosphoribosyltransferase
VVTGRASDPKEGAAQASQALDNGSAARTLARWAAYTQDT